MESKLTITPVNMAERKALGRFSFSHSGLQSGTSLSIVIPDHSPESKVQLLF